MIRAVTALDGPALADALWACADAAGTRPLVPPRIRRWVWGSPGIWTVLESHETMAPQRLVFAETLGEASGHPHWQPWLRVSDCWPALCYFHIGFVHGQTLDGQPLVFLCWWTRPVGWEDTLCVEEPSERAVARAICRLALRLWQPERL